MKVQWTVSGVNWTLNLFPDPDDLSSGAGQRNAVASVQTTIGRLHDEIHVELPRAVRKCHPDLMALAALVVARPWIGSRLYMGTGVSRLFAEVAQHLFRFEVGPVIPGIRPRIAGSTPLLAFSGGVDSVAASEVLPPDTPHIHFRRVEHPEIPERARHVQTEGIERVVQESGRRGRHVEIVRTDLEHISSNYPTLPHWFCIAMGCLLMADEFDGGAVAMGGTLETFYMDMGRRWTGEGGKGIEPLTEVCGLPFLRPMLGVTEIGTMRIAEASDLGDIARSCVLGTIDQPCNVCAKCIRKLMTSAALRGREMPDELRSVTPETPGMKALVGEPPYYMQAQLEYCLSRLDADGELAALYARLGRPAPDSTAWMDGYYRDALDRSTPAPWRDGVLREITRRLDVMSEDDLAVAQAWDR